MQYSSWQEHRDREHSEIHPVSWFTDVSQTQNCIKCVFMNVDISTSRNDFELGRGKEGGEGLT